MDRQPTGHNVEGFAKSPLAPDCSTWFAPILLAAAVLTATSPGRLGAQQPQQPASRQPAATSVAKDGVDEDGVAENGAPPKIDSVQQKLLLKSLSEFNRGSALMEQYKYSDAVKAFEAVLEAMPDWTAARFNLGLAYLNMQGAKDADESLEFARETFQRVLEEDPGNLHALFALGMYYQHLGEDDPAMVCFARVYLADPDDPYVGFKYAETLLGTEATDEGIRVLEKVVADDPGFISGIYRLALQYRRTKGVEEAKLLLERFKELTTIELEGGSFAVEKAYGSAGKYYTVLGPDGHPLARQPVGETPRILFSPDIRELETTTRRWDWPGGSVSMPGIAVADVDSDGDLDLFLTATESSGSGAIWLNDGKGNFTAGARFDVPCVSAAFGDVDNDGDEDLWLGCAGQDILMFNNGAGLFEPVEPGVVAFANALTPLCRLIDIDSDGDLDLFAFRIARGSVPAAGESVGGASSIYNNNRDGTYPDLAEQLGLRLASTPLAAVVCEDLDNDRDLDLLGFPRAVAGTEEQPFIWVNDRVGAYRILQGKEIGISGRGVLSVTTGDPDKDGDRDVLVCTVESTRLYENLGSLRFRLQREFRQRHGALRATGGQFVDIDNDGDLDLLMADAHRHDGTRGPVLLVNDWPAATFTNVALRDPGNLLSAIETEGDASFVAADFTNNGRCDVLIARSGRAPMLIENLTAGGHWIALDLRGTIGRDQMTRSNNSAVGARVEVKTGNVFQQHVVGGSSGPVAATPLRVHAGLGAYPKVDWLRIVWPDAVIQSEQEVAGDRLNTVNELSRKTSSCPYLFAWDGSRFQFVGDFGGVGGLGYLVAPGVYAPPDPTEYVPLPQLRPRDGYYVLNALTVLEEVTYFDEAKLIAVDHPAGTRVLPNEMMAINCSPPDFEVFCFRQPIQPERALDHRGHDVTAELASVDRSYAGATERDYRFAGIAEPHHVELDFGARLADVGEDDRLIFVAHGWVEYGYSSTNYAAAQAGLRTEAPTISVERDGQWVELFREVGYPAGTQHVMTLDVSGKILPTDRKLRIASNMDLYWDQIHLAVHQRDARLKLKEIAAETADLRFFGFPREYSPDGRHPNLSDYENVDRNVSWKLMSGDYTRFGDVTPLVAQADDCFVIMGHGEQLTLQFPASAFGSVPKDCVRSFLLKTDSYCKDMDLYTAYPDTVEPLPFHAMSGYPYGAAEHYPDTPQHEQYRHEYNTRRVRAQAGEADSR